MADIIATLEYKTLEEVLTVIRHLTSILSVSGVNLVDQICPVSEQLRESEERQVTDLILFLVLTS
jgi:cohesin loading factor subunit SCC2